MKSTLRIVAFAAALLASETARAKVEDGLYVLVGVGADELRGPSLSGATNAFAYGATAGWQAGAVGIEGQYSRAATSVSLAAPPGSSPVSGLVRNGGQAAVTLGIPTAVRPYLLAGFGVEKYNIANTNGYIPAGLGLRAELGSFLTADARITYDQPFAFGANTIPVDRRFQGLLEVGGTF